VGDNKSKVLTTAGHKLHQGVAHALLLQLIAAGILSVYVADETKEGTNLLSPNEFVVNWATVVDSDDDSFLAHTDNLQWSPFNCV
jgi:hypothetical protein